MARAEHPTQRRRAREGASWRSYDSSAPAYDSSRQALLARGPVPQSSRRRTFRGAAFPLARIAMRAALLTLIVALPAVADGQSHYLDIYNTAPSSLVAIAVAPAGSGTFRDIALGGKPLRGGGDSTTVAVQPDGGCLRDLRLSFADGRVLEQNRFNVCRYRSYHTGRYWRSATADPKFTAQR
jgi:hypothetical protein